MARSCSICQHPRLYDINKALVARAIAGRTAGFTYRSVAAEFDVSKDALRNHWDREGHNRTGDSSGVQYVLLADGSKAQVIDLEPLLDRALAIALRDMLSRPDTSLAPLPKPDSQGPNKGGEPCQLGGYVYLLEAGHYYKIGRTENLGRRITQLSPAAHEKPELICAIRTDDMYALENQLHDRFAERRTNGEWFKLASADVECIKAMADSDT